ncbi:hypothetical protein AXA65_07215 [Chryseobacterium sp. FP211-J200]|nr:hypothetical protein AXA65_07215 [Chryseobacterium sp. FP211-J200]
MPSLAKCMTISSPEYMDVGAGDETNAWMIRSWLKFLSDKFSWVLIGLTKIDKSLFIVLKIA